MRQDMRKFKGSREGQQERGWSLFVHDSVVAQLG